MNHFCRSFFMLFCQGLFCFILILFLFSLLINSLKATNYRRIYRHINSVVVSCCYFTDQDLSSFLPCYSFSYLFIFRKTLKLYDFFFQWGIIRFLILFPILILIILSQSILSDVCLSHDMDDMRNLLSFRYLKRSLRPS